jgi:hypothetical protein
MDITGCEEEVTDDLTLHANRLKTFQYWPKHLSPDAGSLASAGFVYLFGDRVECHCCGLVLSDWAPGDNAFGEHWRFSKECAFLLKCFGRLIER